MNIARHFCLFTNIFLVLLLYFDLTLSFGSLFVYSVISNSASEKIVCLSSNRRMADADAVTTLAPPQILALHPRTQSDVKMLTVSKAISWSVKTRLYVSKTR